MRTNLGSLLLLTITTLSLATAAQAQSDAAERQKIVGTWEGWLVDGDGSQASQRRQRISEMVITTTQITCKDARGVSMGAGGYRLAAAGATKTIDANGTAGQPSGKNFMGIYKVEGDTLKWCSGNDRAQTRPAEFKTNTGNGHFLMILTRKK